MKYLTLVLLALGLTACGNPDTPAGRAADARHENFEAIGDAAKAVADQLKEAKPDVAKIQSAAATINGFAPKVESWFPAGSGPADGIKTEALQAIWDKPAEFKAEIDKAYAMLDKELADRPYLAGDEYTIADISAYPNVTTTAFMSPRGYEPFPNLKKWADKIGERSAVQRGLKLFK